MLKDPGRLPPLDLLRSFEAAARLLSFTRAAQELFVTQSAVSRAIQALEEHLGTKLFHRRYRALLLTEAGQQLHRVTAEALERLRDACRRIRAADESGTLTVTTTVAFASLWLVPRLHEFRERNPEIEVRIAAENTNSDLERQGIDVAIRYCSPRAVPPGTMKLFGENVFPVCSPKLLRSRHLKTPENLQPQLLLHFDDPAACWPWLQWNVWFEVMRLKPLPLSGGQRFSHYDQLIQAAIAGQGVALGRSPLVRRFIKQGQLAAPFAGHTASSRAYFVLTAKGAGERTVVRRFVTWLEDIANREREALDD
jgi:LysR family transcriptional regulator, glycine cleavage system transcriptional activator